MMAMFEVKFQSGNSCLVLLDDSVVIGQNVKVRFKYHPDNDVATREVPAVVWAKVEVFTF